jgi:uncharacterized metal-binding protein YceD (DUF177 family)
MAEPVPEFSRPVSTARIPPNGVEEALEAKPGERAALAKRFELVEIKSLKAQLDVLPEGQQIFAVTGKIEADIVQQCVVTLEPLAAHIDIDVATTFIPAERHQEGAGSPHPDDTEDEYDVYSGGKIDLGEMVAQHLGVNIDPYPRKTNVAPVAAEFGAKTAKTQPFAQLADAVKNRKKQDKTKE